MKAPTERLQAYVVDVQEPAVSGMEHLEMLFNTLFTKFFDILAD